MVANGLSDCLESIVPPIYRWKSFWLGVLVLAFLCWAWGRSFIRDEWLLFMNYSGGQSAGRVWITRWESTYSVHPLGFITTENAAAFVFGAPVLLEESHDFRSIGFAHWFLILFFLMPLSGWIIWRCRRIKRHQEEIAAIMGTE